MEEKVITKNENALETPKKISIWIKILFFFLLFVLLFYLYIRCVEPKMLIVKETAIIDENVPSSFDGMKIVVFSDILYGSSVNQKNIAKIVDKVNELNPDVVLFLGDLLNDSFQINGHDISVLTESLSRIEAKMKKYAVLGDNDYINKSVYVNIMDTAGFKVLDNENDLLYFEGNDPLLFVGTSSLLEKECDIKKAVQLENRFEDYYQIWLHHEPAILDNLNGNSPNLIFTGHTLGGLMPIPFKGDLLEQDGTLEYRDFYYEHNHTKMYISNGIGTYKYNVRFLNQPSIYLYRLYKN